MIEPAPLPGLKVVASRPAETAAAACKFLARLPFFSMGGVLKELVIGPDGTPELITLTDIAIMRRVEECAPRIYRTTGTGEIIDAAFPRTAAAMVLDMGREEFPALSGFCSVPCLTQKGNIRHTEAFDPKTTLYHHDVPDVVVPSRPTEADACKALAELRLLLRTFPFADAARDEKGWVNQDERPGADEAAALVAILSAVCRPFIDLAPGLLITAPPLSGSGAGKGLLVRTITAIANGAPPRILNVGQRPTELESRLGAALMKASPAVLLDDVNGRVPPSDLLSSILTEPQVEFRELGVSRLVKLHTRTSLYVNGNGTQLQEDTLRRFIICKLDPKVEDADARSFPYDPVQMAMGDRSKYLSAAITIWRRNLQNQSPTGKSFGSFEQWARWCRDASTAPRWSGSANFTPMWPCGLTRAITPHRKVSGAPSKSDWAPTSAA
ncbi:MAG: hypothetical protein JWR10_854 [Rubritepida sp.]|nr:hypothetical protein [Rubritepida sp.]